jgi:YD repeat-containing protein
MSRPKRMVIVRYREQRHVWEVDYQEAGQRRRETFPDERTATAHASEVTERLETQTPPPLDYDILLRDFAQSWKRIEATRTDQRTYEDRVTQLERRVLPLLGAVKVRQLSTDHVLTLLTQLQVRGLSRNAIRLAKDALSMVCGLAVLRGLVKVNPCLKMGVYAKLGGTAAKEPNPLSAVQLAAFAAVMAKRRSPTFRMLFRLMADTGLRPGEARGLKVADIDWLTATLHIERALRKDGRVKTTKTKRTRDVEMSGHLLGALRSYVAERTKQSLAKGWGEPEWLFVTDQNVPVDQRIMRRSFKAACKRAGLRGFRPYDLRATCASHLLSLGAEITFVAQQLGNSPAVVLKFYAKFLPSRTRRWVDQLGEARRAATQEHDASDTRLGAFGTRTRNLDPRMAEPEVKDIAEVPDSVSGEPWWDRTTDPLIKSQVLYQLS